MRKCKVKIFSLVMVILLPGAGNLLRSQKPFIEKISVYTDKPLYHAGEMMWMSCHLTDASTGYFSQLSTILYVELLDSNTHAVCQSIIKINDGRGDGSFQLPALKPGIYLLRAYTNWMKNFDASAFFHQEIAIVNGLVSNTFYSPSSGTMTSPDEDRARIFTDKPDYKRREKVALRFSPPASSDTVFYSLSVFRADDLPVHFYKNTPSSQNDIPRPALQKVDHAYLPEIHGRLINGKITETAGNTPAGDINVYLTVPGYSSGFYNSTSDAGGNITFELPACADSFFVLAEHGAQVSYKINLEDPFYQGTSGVWNKAFTRIDSGSSLLADLRVSAQVENAFHPSHFSTPKSVQQDTMPFFGKPDVTYRLDDFVRFSKMEEVFREYVGPVAVNRRRGSFYFSVYKQQVHETFEGSPLVLIDGYPANDINKLFLFDPLKVESVDVVNHRYYRNGGVFDGIVSLNTYSQDLNGFPVDSHAVVFRNRSAQAPKRFIHQVYETASQQKSRMPDFRSVLTWNPSCIATDNSAEHSFYTSDLKGLFRVQIRYRTSSGKTGSAGASFIVN